MNTTVKTGLNVPKAHHCPVKLMGCRFVLTAIDESPNTAWNAIRAGITEIERIESVISSWIDSSETSHINKNSGVKPTRVSSELFQLIKRSLKVSSLTSGAFDISGNVSRHFWNFDGSESEMLDESTLAELRHLMDYRMIELDEKHGTVYLKRKGMKIGFGGIGKGYAAYRAYQTMRNVGIESGLINAAGDLMCWGSPPNQNTWTIQLPNPSRKHQALMTIDVPFGSVVTSGNYEKYVKVNGKKMSHIVDPRTGLPTLSTKSTTVICPNPELGDALATALSVMGSEEGIALIDRLKGIECILVDQDDRHHTSKGLHHHISNYSISESKTLAVL